MKKEVVIQKRMKARELKKKGWSNRKIARYLVCSPTSVARWLRLDSSQVEEDGRGWQPGMRRKYTKLERERVLQIKAHLERYGASGVDARQILTEYKKRFGREVSLWYVEQILERAGEDIPPPDNSAGDFLSQERVMKKFGKVLMNLSFIATKSQGFDETIHLLHAQYVAPQRYSIVMKIESFSSREVIRSLQSVWQRYCVPDVAAMGLHAAFGANQPKERCIGNVALFLLNLGVKPFYSPLNSGSTSLNSGGNGAIFSEKFNHFLQLLAEPTGPLRIRDLALEFSNGNHVDIGLLKNRAKLFFSLREEAEWRNREVERLREQQMLFFAKAGSLRVLGVAVDPGHRFALDEWVVGRLNVKSARLRLYKLQDGPLLRAVNVIPLPVANLSRR